MITVLFFGRMTDLAGRRRVEIPDEAATLFGLRDRWLAGAAGVHMSVNRDVVREDRKLRDGDEVAFFSIFSGG